GGFAGITAARDLSLRGFRVLILEARPRLGGRTFTTRFANHDLDLGGTWIGSSQPFVWSERMRYGVDVVESAAVAASQAIWMDAGERVTGSVAQYAEIYEQAANRFYAPAREFIPRAYQPLFKGEFGNLDQISAADAIAKLGLPAVQSDLLYSFAAINGHSFASDSSYLDQLRWFALGNYNLWNLWDNLSRYRLAGGTKALIDRMAADSNAEIRLGTPVTHVEQSPTGATVTTVRGEQLQARAVVVAVPLNCLADIEFSPAISEVKLGESRRRHTGSGTKVYARTAGKQPVFLGHGTQQMPLCFAWTEYDDRDSQLLCGFGASPDLLDVNDDRAIASAFARYLPSVGVEESVSYDWNIDPYSKGTWCMYRPGTLTGSLTELQRPEGHIFFAGADIANGWRGFIDGAIESGATVAQQVTQHIVI
ncbi:MAG TPA: NAD(P)/FAD-dependent oxidoreductase, partial [Kineobactrum sp.]